MLKVINLMFHMKITKISQQPKSIGRNIKKNKNHNYSVYQVIPS